MNSLFQQKQRELVLAVSRVEELSRQLEVLKNGRLDGRHDSRSAAAELDRLYKELQVSRALGAVALPRLRGGAQDTCQSVPHGRSEVSRPQLVG